MASTVKYQYKTQTITVIIIDRFVSYNRYSD